MTFDPKDYISTPLPTTKQCKSSLLYTSSRRLKPHSSTNGLWSHIVHKYEEAPKIEFGKSNELAVFGRHTGTATATNESTEKILLRCFHRLNKSDLAGKTCWHGTWVGFSRHSSFSGGSDGRQLTSLVTIRGSSKAQGKSYRLFMY